MTQPETRYARSGDVNIAYQVIGDGPRDLTLALGFATHVEVGTASAAPGRRWIVRLALLCADPIRYTFTVGARAQPRGNRHRHPTEG
jgi:hypothetical protein